MAEEQQNQEQQRSSVDRVNDLINKAQSARKNYKRARAAYNAFKAGRAGMAAVQAGVATQGGVAAGGGAAATSPAWGTAAVVILIIILVIIVFIIVFAGGQNVKAGTPQDCTTIGGTCSSSTTCADIPETDPDTTGAICSDAAKSTCCVPPPPPLPAGCTQYASDPKAGLKTVFNVEATNGSTTDYTKLLGYLCDAARAPNFIGLLTNGGRVLKVYLNNTSNTDGVCSGYSPFDTNTVYFGPWTCGASQRNMEHFVLHEFGHVIYYRNDFLAIRYPLGILRRTNISCYDSAGYLITYSLSGSCSVSDDAGRIKRESFAESMAEYIIPLFTSAGRCSRVISNFPVTCDNTYAWFKTNVFGGYTY